MKKYILITAVILSILSLAWIIYIVASNKNKNATALGPAKPNLTQNYQGTLSIDLSVDKNQFNFPQKLPLLEISRKSLTDSLAGELATNLGFSGEPTKINDATDGMTYFWKSGSETLFMYLKSAKIRYSSGSSLTAPNKQLSDPALIQLAKDFLSKKNVLDTNIFDINTVKYLQETSLNEGFSETDRKNATLYELDIYPKSLKYEILTPNFTNNTNYIQMMLDGNVYSFQLTLFGGFNNGPTEYQLKNYDEAKSSLGSAVLISLGGEETPLGDLSKDTIQKINITKIELAYLLDSPTATVLQPVYKLTGNATLSGNVTTAQAILYLPALSGL